MNFRQVAEIMRRFNLPSFKGNSALTRHDLHEKFYFQTGKHVSDHVIAQACKLNVDQGVWAEHPFGPDARQVCYTKAMSRYQKLQEEVNQLRMMLNQKK